MDVLILLVCNGFYLAVEGVPDSNEGIVVSWIPEVRESCYARHPAALEIYV